MNHPYQIDFRERIFFRSCLESAPTNLAARKVSFSIGNGGNSPPQLHQLKQKLLHSALEKTTDAILSRQLCGIANRAADLAWATACPLLVFPCLFEEMAQVVFAQFQGE